MPNANSSGSQERFTLAPLGSRVFSQDLGGNYVQAECILDSQSLASVQLQLQSSPTGLAGSWTQVGSTITVVPCGAGFLNGTVGQFWQIIMTEGTDQCIVIAKARNICQLVGAPS